MNLRYVGPHDEVTLNIEPSVVVARGGTVEVSEGIAEGLLLQDVWEVAPTKTVKES